ncbi:Lipoprotein, putative [Roseibacterium elongatum DSM 19469]|uniref:Lipoprotein, putative n=1 Tax=Roseicyclus elongatus DSM 19469 TaxID=1294273 RepID=W8S3X2_9RHOB|nr:alpha/beta hydrolase [Roseibacterium elongatum]AHM03466.1 Lipoprotein, putative [Roseibacterium elongatum DSM 19469]
MRLHLVFVVSLGLAVTACSGRSSIQLAPELAGIGANERVYVASTRAFLNGNFTDERLEGLDYLRFDVSVPPDRLPGEVELADATPNPNREFLTTAADRYNGPSTFRSALAGELASRPPEQREVMLFVHGYNSTFADGLYRTAQIRYDFEIPGIPVHYAWSSAGHPFGYAYDRDSALFARDGLETLISEISAVPGARMIVIAHSMGSSMVMEVLRQLRIGNRDDVIADIAGIALLSPDVDIDVFRSQAHRIGHLPQPFFIFTSRRDRALLIAALITGQRSRLGTLGEVDDVSEFEVTLIDTSEFRGGETDSMNHFTAASSAAMVQLLRQIPAVNLALANDPSQQLDLLQGTVLTVRNATQIILAPQVP